MFEAAMVSAIIVAGGMGVRMRQAVRKQYLLLEGIPILARTLTVFLNSALIDRVYAVVPTEDISLCEENIIPFLDQDKTRQKVLTLVAGGKERQDSVFNGLAAVNIADSLVIVHDGVRPFVREDEIAAVLDAAKIHQAAVLGLKVEDTLKKTDSAGRVTGTVPRNQYWHAQTPQAFDYRLLLKAHKKAKADLFYGTDDACLVERMDKPVFMVPGSKFNIKITTPEDLELAGMILSRTLPSNQS